MASIGTERREQDAVAGALSSTPEHRPDPVEMNDLSSSHPDVTAVAATDDATGPGTSPSHDPSHPSTTTTDPTEDHHHPPLDRSETAELALGPDGAPLPELSTSISSTPALRITLMLTTGSRHPYNITERYLRSRKVEALDAEGNFEPRELSGYKLKELIWTDWRPEWEPKPRDPSSIRLILMGRMLDDKTALRELPFSLTNPNVVHMTVKPADLLDDEAEGAGKGTGKNSLRGHGRADDDGAGCRCVIL